MKSSVAIFLLAVAFLSGCTNESIYNPKDVRIVSQGITNEGLKLTFHPINESMYYCPGVMYEQKGNQVFFSFVRLNINQKNTDIHLRAITDKDKNLSVTFPFPENKEKIELINSLGKSLGAWSREEKKDNK